MIGVCYFVLWNGMCRKQRLGKVNYLIGRAIQFNRSFKCIQTKT